MRLCLCVCSAWTNGAELARAAADKNANIFSERVISMAQRVKEVLAAIEPELDACAAAELEAIGALASVDCGTGDLEGNAKVVTIMDGLLAEIPGIAVRHIQTPLGVMIAATLGGGNPNGKIVLNGHLDTVFKRGDVAAHPFRVEGDVGYGLGSADCKGGLVVAVAAVKLLAEKGLLPDKEIRFLFNCDEEIGSPECRGYLRDEAAGAVAALVFEPARDNDGILTMRKGALSFSIETTGVNAHSGLNYKAGRSAVVELAKKIMKLYEHNDDERGIQFNITGIADGGQPHNVVPKFARADVSVRFQNEADKQRIFALMEKIKEPYIDGCTTTVVMHERNLTPAMDRIEGSVKLYEFAKGVGAELGLNLAEQHTGGSGDGGIFATMGIPCIDALGPHMYKTHSLDESFSVPSVKERTRLAACILASM